ncbi:hypothetical protein Tco_0881952, partial [Tanacetum coccineum]
MDAMTIKMDAQYKELQSRAKKQPIPDLDEDDMPMSREEEAKFMQTFRKTRFYNDYRDRDSNHDNWRLSERNDYNRDKYRSNTDDKSYDLQRQFNDFMKSQQSTNAFVKETFMELKTQLETVAKNHQASIQNLETNIDVIDEILEEDFDALLDEGRKILHSIEGTVLEEEIFYEFDKFISMAKNENYDSRSDEEEQKFKKITISTDYKIKTSLEEPPTDLELKPLPDNLEYVFLEEPSFLPVIISSQLSAQNKSKLVSVLKKHKEAFAWKTANIPGIYLSFCKHNIQILDDKKAVVQKQRMLNPNIQEVVKKEIMKLLDTGIIHPIADSPWVSPIHCIPKKGVIIVVTNENDELVPTRTITGWR